MDSSSPALFGHWSSTSPSIQVPLAANAEDGTCDICAGQGSTLTLSTKTWHFLFAKDVFCLTYMGPRPCAVPDEYPSGPLGTFIDFIELGFYATISRAEGPLKVACNQNLLPLLPLKRPCEVG